ncbi:MAG: site-2 protease family protein [bacterium]
MIMSNFALALLNKIALLFPAFLCVFTFRGFFQAFIALIMGDKTARQDGYMSLNPLIHVDIFGVSITMAIFFVLGLAFEGIIPYGMLLLLLLALGIRWTYPIPIEETNFKRYRLGGILTAFSGSIGSLFLAFIFLCIMRLLSLFTLPEYAFLSITKLLSATVDLAIWFCVLDLIPLPPFDGGRALRYIIPYSKQYIVDWLEEYSFYIMIALFFLPGVSNIFWAILYALQFIIEKALISIVF